MCVHVGAPVHACTCMWPWGFLQVFYALFFETGYFTEPVTHLWPRMAGQQCPQVLLSLLPTAGIKDMHCQALPCPAFNMGSGMPTEMPMLAHQHFDH